VGTNTSQQDGTHRHERVVEPCESPAYPAFHDTRRHAPAGPDQRNFFSHESPGGSDLADRVRRTGYLDGARSWALGENIAWGSGSRATPASIVGVWMNSSGHRDNILDRGFEHIGIGVARGAPVPDVSDGATYTTDFGRR
jgi:uncharacterized protein YkwD